MENVPESVADILERLEAAGYEAWCVGGCVRDRLLGRTPGDWDVTTSALPEETMAVFGKRAFPTGLQHGTVTVRTDGGPVEVTTYRLDGDYRDHRRPESVTFTRSLTEDLRRRDFTVNAMALSLRGELRDPFGGQADLETKTLRCVGEADKRFQEDALRILRGLRFAAVLGFAIEPDTAAAIHQNKELLREIAAERIQVELFKLLAGKCAAAVLRDHPDVIGVFWPEVLPMVGFDQQNWHHCYDVWEHTLHALTAAPEDLAVRCSVLLHDIGKPSCFTVDADGVGHFYGHADISRELADQLLRRLKCGNEFRETVVKLVAWHDRDIPRTDKGVRRALRALGETDLRRLLEVKRADNRGQAPEFWDRQAEIDKGEAILDRLLAEDACFSLKQLAVDGRDLMALGLKGPEIGRALGALLDAVVDGRLPNDRDALLEEVGEDAEMNKLWSVYHSEIPGFLREYADTPPLARLRDVGMNCGCEYTQFPRFAKIGSYSRLDHSLGAALIVWHFTGDRKQALAALFHDIATPVFAHVVDFLNGDHLTQSSTEDGTEERIASSKEIQALLERDGLTVEDVADYHRYPIADNDAPALSADRLEYTLGNLVNYGFADLKTVRGFYADLTVGADENGAPELVFRTPEAAAAFTKAALQCARVYVADEDRFAMEALAGLLRTALGRGTLTRADLWTAEPPVIAKLRADPVCGPLWAQFFGYSKVLRAAERPENGAWIQVDAKKRWIDPLAAGLGRVSQWDSEARVQIADFLVLDFGHWLRAQEHTIVGVGKLRLLPQCVASPRAAHFSQP